jgi:hypothetical protein
MSDVGTAPQGPTLGEVERFLADTLEAAKSIDAPAPQIAIALDCVRAIAGIEAMRKPPHEESCERVVRALDGHCDCPNPGWNAALAALLRAASPTTTEN